MTIPYSCQLKHDQNGRIIEKTETVAGRPTTWKYTYDKKGRLYKAHLDGRLICECDYDREGRRTRDYFPATVGPHYRNYQYTMDNRLMRAGNNTYTHDEKGFRNIWSSGGTYYLYEHAPDYRLLKMEVENEDRVYTYNHDEDGQRIAKYLNGHPVEGYQWLDFVRLAGFNDGKNGYEFAYNDGERTPFAMRRDDGAIAGLFYDQVGSLRVVADTSNNVIKEVLYDPFGGIIEDTNPGLRVPIGFAGGLHDRDLGFVRFGWRDYDTYTGRWTAPDPIGDRGGDPDWYGYCLDDPVNQIDPYGLYGALLQYAPAINRYGVAVINDVIDGSYGYANLVEDLGGLAWDTMKGYPHQVDRNIAHQRKERKRIADYYMNKQKEEEIEKQKKKEDKLAQKEQYQQSSNNLSSKNNRNNDSDKDSRSPYGASLGTSKREASWNL